jgi:hypothetical protein
VALDVASFICFLISTAATLAFVWIWSGLEFRKRTPGTILGWALIITESVVAVPFFFMGLLTLIATVASFVQVQLGSTANDGDNLAIVSVSFLAASGCGVLFIAVVAILLRLCVEINGFSKDK